MINSVGFLLLLFYATLWSLLRMSANGSVEDSIENFADARWSPFRVAAMFEPSHPELARKLRGCLAQANIIQNTSTLEEFTQPRYCRRRMCPVCGRQTSRRYGRIYGKYFAEELSRHPHQTLYLITFTQGPVANESPGESLKRVADSAANVCRAIGKGAVLDGHAAFLSLEFSFGNNGRPHAHAHALVHSKSKPAWNELAALWSEASPGSRSPDVQVKARGNQDTWYIQRVCREAVEYITKAFPWPLALNSASADDLLNAAASLQDTRTVRSYGRLWGWSKCLKERKRKAQPPQKPARYRVTRVIEVPAPATGSGRYSVPLRIDDD